jgi:O-succinylbenzoic acid--CoA ligase
VNSLRPVRGGAAEVVAALRDWLAVMAEPAPLVVETSGSTGAPKRVELSRVAIRASVHASARRLGAGGQWLLALPAAYVAGVQVICRSLEAGHEPVVVDGSFAATLAGMPHHRDVPLFTSLVPTQLHRLLTDEREVEALRHLHTILVGGGPVDPTLRRRAEDAGLHVVATYGASETAGGCVYDGHPLDGVAVAIGTDGRIRIGGPTLFEGYVDDREQTARTLVDGWFLTADAGRLDEDGRLQVLGRLDDVVVSGGVNVPLPSVGRRLREHPGVEAAEVLGVEDDEWGQRVVAFVVGVVVLEEVRDWVGEVHPRSWAPRQVVVLDALPLLSNGKVDRRALVALAGEDA